MKILKPILLSLVAMFFVACNLPSDTGDPNQPENKVMEKINKFRDATQKVRNFAHNQTNPQDNAPSAGQGQVLMTEHSGDNDDDPSMPGEEMCEQLTDDEGNIIITCTYGDVTCMETYTSEGNFISWYCNDGMSYACDYFEEEIVCLFDDGLGYTCEDIYDYEYGVIESTCEWGEDIPEEECVPTDNGGMHCSYDDGYMTCEYELDENNNLVWETCESESDSWTCVSEDNKLTCDYDLNGYSPCTEVYATDAAYGLLFSDCDWDNNGEPDCEILETPSFEEALTCEYSDEFSSCVMVFDKQGFVLYYGCEFGEDFIECFRNDDMIECTEVFSGTTCETTYTLDWEYVNQTCDYEPECETDLDCQEGQTCYDGWCYIDEDECRGAWLDENDLCRAPNDGVYPDECCEGMCLTDKDCIDIYGEEVVCEEGYCVGFFFE